MILVSILISLVILLMVRDVDDVFNDSLSVITVLYTTVLLVTQLLPLFEVVVLYNILSTSITLVLMLMIKDVESLLSSLSIIPFKVLEMLFIHNPLILPEILLPYVQDLDSWVLYGIAVLLLKNSFKENSDQIISTKRTIMSGLVAFVLSVPYINYFI